MRNTGRSEKNTLKKTQGAKSAGTKQVTSTTRNAGESTSARSILSWLFVANVTTDATKTPHGRGRKDT